MRKFSDVEKEIIRKLVEFQDSDGKLNNLINVLHELPDLIPTGYLIEAYVWGIDQDNRNKEIKKIGISVSNEIDLNRDYGQKLSKILLTIRELFEYLDKNKNLTFIPHSFDEKTVTVFSALEDKSKAHRFDLLPDYILEELYKYLTYEIYVSQTLINHVENGFLTTEEKHNKRQLRVTQIALATSILGLLFTNGYQIYKDNSKTIKTSMKNCSVGDVSSEIKEVSEKLQSITVNLNNLVKGQREVANNIDNLYKK